MSKRAFVVATTIVSFVSIGLWGQSSCGNTTLSCLIPTALHTSSNTFNFVNEAFGTQIAQLPLASPASGFVYALDKSGVYTSFSESFGPLLAERSETIGRHKVYVAFTYQRFNFSDIDGIDTKSVPVLFAFPSEQNPQVVTNTQNRIDTKVDQFVAFGTFGLTSRMDFSIAVPYERISMRVNSSGAEYSTTTTATASFIESVAGSAHGVGDVLLSAKGMLVKHEQYGVAAGIEVRFPTGDERNFLGSGAYGIKPFLILSRRGRFSPHLNLGYQWNGSSLLAADATGAQQSLPADLFYAGGVDAGLTNRLTVGVDLLGQHFFDAPQISKPRVLTASVNNEPTQFSSVQLVTGTGYNVNNFSLGMKLNPVRHLLISANALIRLDKGGLRSPVVPLVGISSSF